MCSENKHHAIMAAILQQSCTDIEAIYSTVLTTLYTRKEVLLLATFQVLIFLSSRGVEQQC